MYEHLRVYVYIDFGCVHRKQLLLFVIAASSYGSVEESQPKRNEMKKEMISYWLSLSERFGCNCNCHLIFL